MDVIVFETPVYRKMEQMYFDICDKYNALSKEHTASKVQLLTVKEVAAILNYEEKTIYNRKGEIGYIKNGKEIRFEPAMVQDWIKRNSIKPKLK